VCKVGIYEARAENFSHLLPKNAYPDYQLDERNIILKCKTCHDKWHQHYEGLYFSPGWKWVVERYLELKKEAYAKPIIEGDQGQSNGQFPPVLEPGMLASVPVDHKDLYEVRVDSNRLEDHQGGGSGRGEGAGEDRAQGAQDQQDGAEVRITLGGSEEGRPDP
jgi:hypothetical protein